jgi:protein TonB
MIVQEQDRVPIAAWGVSFAVHGAALCVAFLLAAQVQPILKEEIFQWEVALVQPSSDSPRTETAQSTPTVQPSKPTPVRAVQAAQPVQPVEPASDMVMTRVATPYSPEVVHPTIVPPKPEPVQEIVQAKVTPVAPPEPKKEEIKQEEIKPQEVVQPQPVIHEPHPAPVPKEVTPPVESVVTAQAYEPPAPSRAHHAESAPVIHHESPSPEEMAPEWRPLTAAVGRSAHAVAEPSAPAVSSSTPDASIAAAVPAPASAAAIQAPPHHANVPIVANAASVRPASKADNAWLAESLGRRIKELTRYPSSARLNGSEGKVVLRVVLRADGHLVDVVVHRSSGHEVLDRAAMETVRLACPIHMKQALSAAEVAVYVPIVYSLAG